MPALTTEHFQKLPASVQNFIHQVISRLHPEEILLFGSRARETHRPNSDFDFAVKAPGADASAWARLLVDLDNEPFTLHKIDLVPAPSIEILSRTPIASCRNFMTC